MANTPPTPEQMERINALRAHLGHDVLMRELRTAKLHGETRGEFLDRMDREYPWRDLPHPSLLEAYARG